MKATLNKLLDRYIYEASNSARSYCPDCFNELKHNSKNCPECGSKRKSVEVQLHESIYIGKRPPKKIRRSFYVPLLHIIVYGLLGYILTQIDFQFIKLTSDTLDWFFSTVTQAYIALIALLIAVTTFRLQTNKSERAELAKRVYEQSLYFLGNKAQGMTYDDTINFAKSMNKNDHNDKNRVDDIKNLSQRITFLDRSSLTSVKNLKITFWSCVAAALSSLVFLVFADHILIFQMEIVAILIVIEAVIVSTFYTWKLVKSLR